MTDTTILPTEEQCHILDLARRTDDNLMINSYAGTGKTATLVMIEQAIKTKPILYLVFAKRNKEEAEERMSSTTKVKNFNGLGHGIWSQACGQKNATVVKTKTQDIVREIIQAAPKSAQGPMWDSYHAVVSAVGRAKAVGYVPDGSYPTAKRLCTTADFHAGLEEDPDDLTIDMIDATLVRSIQQSYKGIINFDDQLYMPALFGGTFPQFPLVMVDERQDLNPVQEKMVEKLCKRSRQIAVGDPCQNIYGFRGAKRDGMADAIKQYNMTEATLSVSFRCPKAIVEAVRWRVPEFQWVKPGGQYVQLPNMDSGNFPDNCTILSRNNAPLYRLAMALLTAGRSVSVSGSDIGPKLLAIMKKLGDEDMSQASLLDAIEDWRAEKLARSSTTANDLADCMKVFASFGKTLSTAIAYAEHLFAQKGTIKLMTGHKAKGLEWDNVYHLDPWLISETDQDRNLRYVITTRSADRLSEIDTRNIRW